MANGISSSEHPFSIELPSITPQVNSDLLVNSSNPKGDSNDATNPSTCRRTTSPKPRVFSPIKESNMPVFGCITFTCIVITIGVLIVCLTARKPSQTCNLTFKRTIGDSKGYNSYPRSSALGHFNNDTYLDIVVADFGINSIGIFLAYANETFASQQTYSTGDGSLPYSIIVGDFNNDSRLDVAVANYGTNNIGIFIGYGNGSFAAQSMVSTGSSRPWFIAVGDINNDKRLDIVVANYGTENVGIFLGYGDGSFGSQTILSTGYDSIPRSVAVADLNNDNRLDIIVANSGTDNIGLFLGYGNGSFVSQKIYSTNAGSSPYSIAIGDFNNDKWLDIAVAKHKINNIGVFLSNGNGSFAMITNYPTTPGSRLEYIAVGDFNKDNQLDIAVVDSGNENVQVLLGHNDGTFSTVTAYLTGYGTRPFSIAVGDFTNDNGSDIVVVNYGTNHVLVLIGYSSIPSAAQTMYSIGYNSRSSSLFISDFNHDNQLDIVAVNFGGDSVIVLLGYGNGSFAKSTTYSTGSGSAPQYVCVADLNNDNQSDIIVANAGNDNVGVLFGYGNGTFATVITYSTGAGSVPLFVGVHDFNNDNQLDMVVSTLGDNTVVVLLGFGNETFQIFAEYSLGSNANPFSLAIGDFNNDNISDIAVPITASNSIGVFLGVGNGTFGNLTQFSSGVGCQAVWVVVADINNDRQLDIVFTNQVGDSVGVLLGHGDGTFNEVILYSNGDLSTPLYLTLCDFNNDGYLDIIIANFAGDSVNVLFGYDNGTFVNARIFSTGLGSRPYGVGVGDFNNDNQLDIAVTNWGIGTVGVLFTYDAAVFASQTTFSTGSGSHPYSVAVGDFNNDNRLDIIVANSGTDNIGVRLGYGNGTFGTQTAYSMGSDSRPQYVTVGDFNQDNHLDIAIAESGDDSLGIFLGYGNGSFATETTYSTGDGSRPSAVAFGYFNNDNRTDFVVVNGGTDSISVFIGFNYATFRRQEMYASEQSSAPSAIVVYDLNNDNQLDIIIANSGTDDIGIFLGYSNGTFTIITTYSTGHGSKPNAVALGDVNNDNKMDVVTANRGTDSVGVFLGYGNGSFRTVITYSIEYGSSPYAITVGNFNKDNHLDIVVTNSFTNNIGVLLGYGDGIFEIMTTYTTDAGSTPYGMTMGDFNNDNQLDVAVANFLANTVGVFLGNGNGTFENQRTFSTGDFSQPMALTVGDFNSDNILDIAVANSNLNNVVILLGYGNGTFASLVMYSTGDGSSPESICVGDMNNDNILDITVGNSLSSNTVVLFGFGDGTFLLGVAYSTGSASYPTGVAVGDFNNDARLDIAIANSATNNIGIFIRDGIAPYGSVVPYSTGSGSEPYSIAIGDFDSDKRSDVAVANYGTNTIGVLLGNGDGTFQAVVTFSTGDGSCPYAIVLGDFNNDSKLDIVVANSATNNILVFQGYGNGTFTIMASYSTEDRSQPSAIAISDFNNDNLLDIVVTNAGTNTALVFLGYGSGTFGHETFYSFGYDSQPYGVAVGDFNADGWMDIAVANYGTDYVEILLKLC